MTGDSGFPKDETSTGCDRAPRKRPVAEEQDAMSNSTQDVVAHLLPAVVAVVVFLGVVLGVPYMMVETGFASWLVSTSRAHPIIVGVALVVTGIPLFICAGRMFGRK
ncbi:hypothetical protein ACUXIL_003314 [Ralstonia pickettii]